MAIDNIRDMLKRDEGVRAFPYFDTVGKLTVGVGRNLTDVGLSPEEIDLLLDNDIRVAEALCVKRVLGFGLLSVPRKAVLVNLMFNLGPTRLAGFKNFLAAVGEGRYADAAAELLDSTYAKQVGQRAVRLARQMEEGTWVQ